MWSSDLWHSFSLALTPRASVFLECLYGAVTTLLIFAGTQDWRRREVSNWMTIPLFTAGLIACVWRIFTDPLNGIAVAIMIVLLTAAIWKKDWMGGADWKVLVGLLGLWPSAGIMSLIVAGIWGAIAMVRTRSPRVRLPGVSAFAIAVVLTWIVTLCS